MREMGAMWQIGGFAGNPCTFWATNESFLAFSQERVSMGFDVESHIPTVFLDASKQWLSTGIYSINSDSDWLRLETPKAPQNGQM